MSDITRQLPPVLPSGESLWLYALLTMRHMARYRQTWRSLRNQKYTKLSSEEDRATATDNTNRKFREVYGHVVFEICEWTDIQTRLSQYFAPLPWVKWSVDYVHERIKTCVKHRLSARWSWSTLIISIRSGNFAQVFVKIFGSYSLSSAFYCRVLSTFGSLSGYLYY